MTRRASIVRTTRETDIRLELNLDGSGATSVSTGIGFLDHMLTALGKHARLAHMWTFHGACACIFGGQIQGYR